MTIPLPGFPLFDQLTNPATNPTNPNQFSCDLRCPYSQRLLPDCPLCADPRGFPAYASRRCRAFLSPVYHSPRALPSLTPSSRPSLPRSTTPTSSTTPLPFIRIAMCGYRRLDISAHCGTFCSVPSTAPSLPPAPGRPSPRRGPWPAVGAGRGAEERAHDLRALGTGSTGYLPIPSSAMKSVCECD